VTTKSCEFRTQSTNFSVIHDNGTFDWFLGQQAYGLVHFTYTVETIDVFRICASEGRYPSFFPKPRSANRLLSSTISGKFSKIKEEGAVSWFWYRKPRRLAPSDVEIRLRCLEASSRIASSEFADGATSSAIAEDAMQIADVYFAYVKGIPLGANLRRAPDQKKVDIALQRIGVLVSLANAGRLNASNRNEK